LKGLTPKRIKLVAMWANESELYACAKAARGLNFSQPVLEFNGYALELPSPIEADSCGGLGSSLPVE